MARRLDIGHGIGKEPYSLGAVHVACGSPHQPECPKEEVAGETTARPGGCQPIDSRVTASPSDPGVDFPQIQCQTGLKRAAATTYSAPRARITGSSEALVY